MNGGMPVAIFTSCYLGRCSDMLTYMQVNFPELGLRRDDCQEMSWIQSVLHFAGYGLDTPETILLERISQIKQFNKGTTDFVTDLIPLKHGKKYLIDFSTKGLELCI